MKKIRILGIIGLCLCITACSESKIVNENSGKPESENEVSTEATNEFTNVSKAINEKTMENDEDAISLKDGLKDETLVTVGEDENGYGILGVNIKEENNQVLLCKDPIYGIVYYVNYGVDYFIYRLKDGKSELAVEMPAKRLFCIDGKLYFMLESYDTYALKDMKDGNIFCYNPVSGEVLMISDAEAETMFVYDEGVYFKVGTMGEDYSNGTWSMNEDLFYYSFATSKIEAINDVYVTPYKWMDYHVTYEVEEAEAGDELYKIYGTEKKITKTVGLKLETPDKSKSIELTVNPNIRNYTIVENKFYYILESKTLIIFDIETKETEEIPLVINCSNDFTILNGIIYLDSLLQINPETGIQSMIIPENEGEIIYELYTDGENLYGVCGSMGGIGYGVMKRIGLEEFPDNAIIVEKENGTSYEMNRFVFRTLPMGEE